jgi:serine/threonine protein kinase
LVDIWRDDEFFFPHSGALISYLQSPEGEKTSLSQLTQFAISCTECVAFLHSREIIHRDIAARNFLLTASLQVKMSDFGMTKMSDYYYGGAEKALPIRWLSPEVMLRRKFSFESDRWALGVTLWEIFSFGALPYAELVNNEVTEKVMKKQVKLRKMPEMKAWSFAVISACKKHVTRSSRVENVLFADSCVCINLLFT